MHYSSYFTQSHGEKNLRGRLSVFMHLAVTLMTDRETANQFYMGFSMGTDLRDTDARLHLRNLIISNKIGNTFKMHQSLLWAASIMAVNRHVEKKPTGPRDLTYNPRVMSFPRLIDCPIGHPTNDGAFKLVAQKAAE